MALSEIDVVVENLLSLCKIYIAAAASAFSFSPTAGGAVFLYFRAYGDALPYFCFFVRSPRSIHRDAFSLDMVRSTIQSIRRSAHHSIHAKVSPIDFFHLFAVFRGFWKYFLLTHLRIFFLLFSIIFLCVLSSH